MKFKIRFADQIVGFFILVAFLGLAGILILIGYNQRWFAKNYLFRSKFQSANGLSIGMPIKLKGFEIGTVRKISLKRDNTVDIEFHIYDNYYDKIISNSVLELATNPLGLGGGLRFHPGKEIGPPLTELSFIPSLDFDKGKQLVSENLVDLPKGEDVINSVLGKVDSTLTSLNSLIVSLDDAVNGRGKGPVSDILKDLTDTSTHLNDLLVNLKGISADVEATTATLGNSTGLVRRLLDPKGSMATLLDDDNVLFDQIVQVVEELNAFIKQLSEFGNFVNSTQPQITGILEKGKVALDKGNDVLEAVKNNPLLRGGIPEKKEQQTTFQSYRDEDF